MAGWVIKIHPTTSYAVLPFISLLLATRKTTFIKTYGQDVLCVPGEKNIPPFTGYVSQLSPTLYFPSCASVKVYFLNISR